MKRYIEIQIGLLIFIFLGILIIINLIFSRHRLRFDLTATKRYSLSTQTIKVLKNLKRPVKVIGFFATGAERNKAKELLEEYSYRSSKFKYTFIDPDRHPLEAKRYGITTYNTIVISCGEKEEKVSSTTEEAITNALIRVTRPGKKTIYFLSGHGEHPIDDIGK
ncbi:MAG: GldG family protein, partial [Deltaproteobacteria bacterium]|nr:GldG family protein [Deltaproteobacteria bacterium]